MKKKTIIIGIIAIAALLVIWGASTRFGSSTTGKAVKETEGVKEFNVKAYRFGYTPDKITVQKGDTVRIKVENTDTIHGMRIPDLGINGTESLEFTADKEGEFTWYCNVMCGEKHMVMNGTLIVT
jgi:cytochrome c oxidase subunit 2